MDNPPRCPHCGIPWEHTETIYEHFLAVYGDETRARYEAALFGDTPETPRHFGQNMVAIYDIDSDRTTQLRCTSCDTVFDRFTLEEVT